MSKYKIGSRHSRLVITGYFEKENHSGWGVMCQCDCGSTKRIANPNRLRHGRIKSCGCRAVEAKSENGKKRGGQNRLPPGIAARNALYNRYKGQAKFRQIPFKLPKTVFFELTSKNCHYCGAPPQSVANTHKRTGELRLTGSYTYNGIDRADSGLGYTVGNSVPCCKMCQYAKRDYTVSEFLSWANRLTSFQSNHLTAPGADVETSVLS